MNDKTGAAFPQPLYEGPDSLMRPRDFGTGSGMSIRDYFAARAMQGMLTANPPCKKSEDIVELIAKCAYHMADAMITEREKPSRE